MWSVPDGSPPLAQGESAFNAVEIDDLAGGPKKDNIAKCLVKVRKQNHAWVIHQAIFERRRPRILKCGTS